jgi:hypothetical protein
VYVHVVQISHGDKKVLVYVYVTGVVFFITYTEKTVIHVNSEVEFV